MTTALDRKSYTGINDTNNTSCLKLKRDLCQIIRLFHENLTSWYLECDRKETFKHQIKSFLPTYIEKILRSNSSAKIENFPSCQDSQVHKIWKNRNMEFVKLCKLMFEQINMHQSIIGGFVQARAVWLKDGKGLQVLFNLKHLVLSYSIQF